MSLSKPEHGGAARITTNRASDTSASGKSFALSAPDTHGSLLRNGVPVTLWVSHRQERQARQVRCKEGCPTLNQILRWVKHAMTLASLALLAVQSSVRCFIGRLGQRWRLRNLVFVPKNYSLTFTFHCLRDGHRP